MPALRAPGVYRTIALRAMGMPVKEIARLRRRSPKSIRETLQRHAPELLDPRARKAPNPGGKGGEKARKRYQKG